MVTLDQRLGQASTRSAQATRCRLANQGISTSRRHKCSCSLCRWLLGPGLLTCSLVCSSGLSPACSVGVRCCCSSPLGSRRLGLFAVNKRGLDSLPMRSDRSKGGCALSMTLSRICRARESLSKSRENDLRCGREAGHSNAESGSGEAGSGSRCRGSERCSNRSEHIVLPGSMSSANLNSSGPVMCGPGAPLPEPRTGFVNRSNEQATNFLVTMDHCFAASLWVTIEISRER